MRVLTILTAVTLLSHQTFASDRLVIHEWGTFTSLQDESGKTIGGIDEDVEPLPSFVHSISPQNSAAKGLPGVDDPNITMRLETPVVYFHPQGNSPMSLTYSATFFGGLLTQFYPNAETGLNPAKIPPINKSTIGRLSWTNVQLGPGTTPPATQSHVWLAPRAVKAADVTAGNHESERFLFYRGVANLDAPIKIVRTLKSDQAKLNIVMQARINNPQSMVVAVNASLDKVWYLDMRPDGKCAYQSVGPLAAPVLGDTIGSLDANFSESQYGPDNLKKLRADMRAAIIADGLFDDEADAMLNTWENAYFKSPGTRVFYLVPENWTNEILPVTVSVPSNLTRVMVGRIDLITPRDRAILEKLSAGSSDLKDSQVTSRLHELGRFAEPMLRDQAAHHPSPTLDKIAAAMAQ